MSGRGTHHAGGLVLGLAVGQTAVWAGASVGAGLAVAGVACLTGGGPMSPDVDQYRAWRMLDRVLPDELLGAGGPLQHRGVSHWPGTTVAVGVAWWLLLAVTPLDRLWWAAVGHVTGWVSHLLLDVLYGRRVMTPDGQIIVRAGIPLAPWWGHVGGLWRSSGDGSRAMGVLLAAVACGQVLLLVGGAP